MSATWTCQRCGASVLGSECSCMDDRDKRIAELEARAKAVVEVLRGSGGIDPEAAKAINELAALLREE